MPLLRDGNLLPDNRDARRLPGARRALREQRTGLFFTSFAAGQDFGPFFGFTVSARTAARILGAALLQPEQQNASTSSTWPAASRARAPPRSAERPLLYCVPDRRSQKFKETHTAMPAPALPTFLIIGAAKSGTTSLYRYLSEHPQVFMSPVKEPAFWAFGGATSAWSARSIAPSRYVQAMADYQRLFAGRLTSSPAARRRLLLYRNGQQIAFSSVCHNQANRNPTAAGRACVFAFSDECT